MALVHLPSCVVVFDDKHTQGSLKAFAADGVSLGPLLRIWVFLIFLPVGFFLVFSVDDIFWLRVSCILCCSFQRPGAWCGFYTRCFSSTVSTASTMGWTGWKFVVAISFGMRAIFVLIASASGLS